jgi:hypothetical protein
MADCALSQLVLLRSEQFAERAFARRRLRVRAVVPEQCRLIAVCRNQQGTREDDQRKAHVDLRALFIALGLCEAARLDQTRPRRTERVAKYGLWPGRVCGGQQPASTSWCGCKKMKSLSALYPSGLSAPLVTNSRGV